jgi:ABC-type nitrate/sulfonate/bicarbonate transport system permease component
MTPRTGTTTNWLRPGEASLSNDTAPLTSAPPVPRAATGPTARRRSRTWSASSPIARYVLPLGSLTVFITIWQLVGGRVDPLLFATPASVVRALWNMIDSGVLWPAFATSMEDLAAGYALAVVVGIVVGLLVGRSQVVERILNPYINFFQATPLIALVPLVVIWFGIGFEARVVVVFMLAVWSILISTAAGVKQTPPSLKDVGRVYKYNWLQFITRIELPHAIPNIFAGLRIALGKALIGMVIAQMEITVTGLGGLVVNYGNAFKTAYLLGAIFTASLVGVVAAMILELIRKWVFPWTIADDSGGRPPEIKPGRTLS